MAYFTFLIITKEESETQRSELTGPRFYKRQSWDASRAFQPPKPVLFTTLLRTPQPNLCPRSIIATTLGRKGLRQARFTDLETAI